MTALPTGTVAFLFTDIEGSTGLYQHFPEAMPGALARHHALLRSAIESHQGHVFQIVGDAFCAAFADAADAVRAALDAQRALHAEAWAETGPLRVRMGIHVGAAEATANDYLSSLTLIRVQRLMSAGSGGQILLSLAAEELVRDRLPRGVHLRDLGTHRLRGLTQPEQIFQLEAPDLPREFPPLRVPVQTETPETTLWLDQLVRGQLVGRGAEIAQLEQLWNLVNRTPARVTAHLALLSGEPGVGKTRLAEALMAAARRDGAIVLRGGCYELEATTPYLPFVEMLRDWTQAQDPQTLRELLGDTAPEINKLAPAVESKLGALPPSPPLSPNEDRLRLFDSVARLLQALAAERGLLLFIDDLHWADQGTLNLLHYILRRLQGARALVLAAYREVELDRTHPLAAALVEWNRERLATRLALKRLTPDDTGALLAALFGQARVSDDFAALVYRETEGNPFFIEEVMKALIEQGEIYRVGDRWERKELHELVLPQSVKEAIGRRLNRLSEPTVQVLHTAAALGKVFTFGELVAVTRTGARQENAPLHEDALLDALDEASAAQLIRPDREDEFAFTHDKIREVLYEELNAIRRRRLHQRIADGLASLQTTGTPDRRVRPADLAYHYALAGDWEHALSYSLRAADEAERVFAFDEALRDLERAREAADALARHERLAEIYERGGDIHRMRGSTPEAIASYRQALERVTARNRRAALNAKIGDIYVGVGDERGLPFIQTALEELDPETQRNDLALAWALRGRHHHYRTEHLRAIEYLERARALAEPLDDTYILSQIYSYLAGAYQHLARYDDSDLWARMGIALGERKGDPYAESLGYEFLGENAFGRGWWRKALEYSAHERALADKMGALARRAWAEFTHASALYGMGALRQAEQVTRAAIELCEQIGEGRLATWLEPLSSLALTDLGEDARAFEHAQRGVERGERLGQLVLWCWARSALGYYYLQRGEPAEAFVQYELCLKRWTETENRVSELFSAAWAVLAAWRAGRHDLAHEWLERELAFTATTGTPHARAMTLAVQGEILSDREQWTDAARVLDEAIATFEEYETRLELGRALVRRSRVQRALGHTEAAQADVTRAKAIFEEIGAKRDAGTVGELLLD